MRSDSAERGGTQLAELTTGGLLLVLGGVFTLVGIFFLPFLCVGVPLLIVGLILALAESGQFSRRASFPYPGYGPAYPYPQYPTMPPASPAREPQDVVATSPAPPPTRFCVSCGSALMESAAFCARCGAPVQR